MHLAGSALSCSLGLGLGLEEVFVFGSKSESSVCFELQFGVRGGKVKVRVRSGFGNVFDAKGSIGLGSGWLG